jgi:hypothetical protein
MLLRLLLTTPCLPAFALRLLLRHFLETSLQRLSLPLASAYHITNRPYGLTEGTAHALEKELEHCAT